MCQADFLFNLGFINVDIDLEEIRAFVILRANETANRSHFKESKYAK